jgi:hypothetical protein
MKVFALFALQFIMLMSAPTAHASAIYHTNNTEEFSLGILGGSYSNNSSTDRDDHGLAFDFCYMHRVYGDLFFDLRYMQLFGGGDSGSGLTKLEARDDIRLPAIGMSVLFFDFLKLNLDYGLAWLKHSDTFPNAAANTSTADKAQGRAWILGVSLIPPIHVGVMKFGLSASYFSASAKYYSHDVFVSGVETKTTGGSASASGALFGASVFFGF